MTPDEYYATVLAHPAVDIEDLDRDVIDTLAAGLARAAQDAVAALASLREVWPPVAAGYADARAERADACQARDAAVDASTDLRRRTLSPALVDAFAGPGVVHVPVDTQAELRHAEQAVDRAEAAVIGACRRFDRAEHVYLAHIDRRLELLRAIAAGTPAPSTTTPRPRTTPLSTTAPLSAPQVDAPPGQADAAPAARTPA